MFLIGSNRSLGAGLKKVTVGDKFCTVAQGSTRPSLVPQPIPSLRKAL